MFPEKLHHRNGATAMEGIDESRRDIEIDETEEMPGIIDAVNGEADTLSYEKINQGKAKWITFSLFEAPSKVRVSRVVGVGFVARKTIGSEEPFGEFGWRFDLGFGFSGEEVEFVGHAWPKGDAIVQKIGKEAEEGFEGIPVSVGIF